MLQQLTDKVYYYPCTRGGRPLLGYVRGSERSLAVDAGYSDRHVAEFYAALVAISLPLPDYTALTHCHLDHSFGLYACHGSGVACDLTNLKLRCHLRNSTREGYREYLMHDPGFAAEFGHGEPITIVPAPIEFSDELTLNLGGVTARLFRVDSPHTYDSVCVHIPEEGVLFLGDATYGKYSESWGPNHARLRSLVRVIERCDCRWCLCSHGSPQEKSALLPHLYSVLERAAKE